MGIEDRRLEHAKSFTAGSLSRDLIKKESGTLCNVVESVIHGWAKGEGGGKTEEWETPRNEQSDECAKPDREDCYSKQGKQLILDTPIRSVCREGRENCND